MKKIIVLTVLCVIACCSLVACQPQNKNVEGISQQNVGSQSAQDEISIQEDSKVNDNIQRNADFYSDEKKIVFKINEVTHAVFYYEEDNITGYETFITFNTVEEAEKAKSDYMETFDKTSSIESVTVFENYLILKHKKDEYGRLKLADLKEKYGDKEQIKEK